MTGTVVSTPDPHVDAEAKSAPAGSAAGVHPVAADGARTLAPGASDTLPGVIDCLTGPVIQPPTLQQDCTGDGTVVNIVWDSWDALGATGHGIEAESSEPVEVQLANPGLLDGNTVFRSIQFNGQETGIMSPEPRPAPAL